MASFRRNVLLWWASVLVVAICEQPHLLTVSHLQTEAQSPKQCLADRTAMMRTADPTQHDRGQHVCMRVERGWRAVDACTSSPLHTLTLIYVFSAWRVSKVSAVARAKKSNRFKFSSGPPAPSHSPETCSLGRGDLAALTCSICECGCEGCFCHSMLAWQGVGDLSRMWPRLLLKGSWVVLMDEVISLTTMENTSPATCRWHLKRLLCVYSVLWELVCGHNDHFSLKDLSRGAIKHSSSTP